MAKDTSDRRFLYGEDLRRGESYQEFTLTIAEVLEEDSMHAQDSTPIPGLPLRFKETEKLLVLRSTNRRLATAVLGNQYEDWPGKKITLYPVSGHWFGQRDVLAVRVRVPMGKPKPFIKPATLGKDLT